MAVFEHVLRYQPFWLNIQRSFDEFVAREGRKQYLQHQLLGKTIP
jgi:hypothetical protein